MREPELSSPLGLTSGGAHRTNRGKPVSLNKLPFHYIETIFFCSSSFNFQLNALFSHSQNPGSVASVRGSQLMMLDSMTVILGVGGVKVKTKY